MSAFFSRNAVSLFVIFVIFFVAGLITMISAMDLSDTKDLGDPNLFMMYAGIALHSIGWAGVILCIVFGLNAEDDYSDSET